MEEKNTPLSDPNLNSNQSKLGNNPASKPSGLLPPPTPPQKKKSSTGVTKTLQIVTIVLAIALIACVAYIYTITKQSKEDVALLNREKELVVMDLEQLRTDYGELKTVNDTLNTQINSERKKIDVLMERIKTTEATSRATIRQYEREVSTMKALLTGYVHQIDSLNVLNRALRDENTKVKNEISQSRQQVEQLSQETNALKSMVEKGGELKIRDITATPLTDRDKVATRARQTEQIRVCLTLIENTIAKRGTRSVYIRVKSPDGSLLTQSVTNLFNPVSGGAQLIYSAMRDVDYNGDDLEVCVFYKDTDFMAGAFDIEVFLDGAYVGSTQLVLK